MESRENRDFDLYKDIQGRTNGEIYIGVVGPVRTGKSTFIKRFMDLFVLPNMEDENARRRAEDELPQSAAGKTIMTTEPKFIPHIRMAITAISSTGTTVIRNPEPIHIAPSGRTTVSKKWAPASMPIPAK